MARIGVTFEDVSDAAARLLLNGKSPTVARIRESLETGSNTTIARHLRQWRKTQQNIAKSVFPEAFPESLIPLMQSLWQKALTESEQRFNEKQNDWQKARLAQQSMLDEFESELNATITSNETFQRTIESQKLELENLAQKNTQLKQEFSQFQTDQVEIRKKLEWEVFALKNQLK